MFCRQTQLGDGVRNNDCVSLRIIIDDKVNLRTMRRYFVFIVYPSFSDIVNSNITLIVIKCVYKIYIVMRPVTGRYRSVGI